MGKNSKAPKKADFFKQNQLILCLSVGFVVMVIMSLPTVMVIVFALLPTFVAFIVDKTPGKSAVICVGSLNLCGVLPYLIDLWTGENSMDGAILILTDVFSLVVIYGASAFGWMIFQSLPPIVATFITILAQSRVSSLRSAQRKFIEEWGSDVATPQKVFERPNRFSEESTGETEAQPSPAGSETENLLDGVDDLLQDGSAQLAPGSTPTETT
jgi:hypothetical protein